MRIALLGVAAFAATAAAQGPVAVYTAGQLRDGVDAYWGSINTIHVSAVSSMPGPVVDDIVRDHRVAATLKGDKVYIDHTYGGSPVFEGKIANRIYAFDGVRSTEQDTTNGGAALRAGRYFNTSPQHEPGYFFLCMLTTAGGSFGADTPLLSFPAFMSQPNLWVRPVLEDVDGHWCHVVDLPSSHTPGNLASVWIDAERGFMPIRRVIWGGPLGNDLQMEARIDEAVELPTGHWMPVRGRYHDGVLPPIAQAGSPPPGLTVVEVERDAQGAYAVAVNQPVEDSLFALHEHIPAGFRILDMDTRESWIASTGDYESAGRSLATVIENSNLRLRRSDVPVQATARDLTRPDGGLMVAHAASGLGGAALAFVAGLVTTRRRR